MKQTERKGLFMNHIQKKSKNKSIAHTLVKLLIFCSFIPVLIIFDIRRLLSHVLECLDQPKQHDQDKFRRNHSKRKSETEYPNSFNARICRKGNDAQRIKI